MARLAFLLAPFTATLNSPKVSNANASQNLFSSNLQGPRHCDGSSSVERLARGWHSVENCCLVANKHGYCGLYVVVNFSEFPYESIVGTSLVYVDLIINYPT